MPRNRGPEGRRLSLAVPGYTQIVLDEIARDEQGPKNWWHPKSPPGNNHKIFDLALMKFVNGNLNYPDLKNMLLHARDPNPWYNPAYRATLQVCKALKSLIEEAGPFGRMCLWRVESGKYIAPHTDNYFYHRYINRWLYFLNLTSEQTEVVFADEKIDAGAGQLVELQPFNERHSLKNCSEKVWYFLVFDTWDLDDLRRVTAENLNLARYEKDPERVVYMSPH